MTRLTKNRVPNSFGQSGRYLRNFPLRALLSSFTHQLSRLSRTVTNAVLLD